MAATHSASFSSSDRSAKPGAGLDRTEALLKLGIGFAQRSFRLNVKMTCEVNDREQQVAELLQHPWMIALGIELGQFLVDLGARTGWIGPVEAGARGTALQLGRPFERRKRQGNAGQGAFVGRYFALGGLDVLPAGTVLGIAEDMRMTALELVADARDHVLEREMAGFVSHLRVEHDLELEIAEFVGERVHIVASDGVSDLIGFFDRIRGDGREALRAIPFAAAHRIAEAAHDGDQTLKRHRGPQGGLRGPLAPAISKYDNMHYVKYIRDQETRISHRPSTPQRLRDDRKFIPSTFKSSLSAICSPTSLRSIPPTSNWAARPLDTRMMPLPVRTN